MRKTGVFTILLASLVVSGCSIQDLMFWKKNAPIATNTIRMARGFMIVVKEMPEDFKAVSSTCSPKSPKVIKAANRILNGKASGTIDNAA